MPTYQYACTNAECANRFELVQAFTDPSVSTCPVCASAVRKVYGSVGVVFKGSGFYRNDSRQDAASKEAAANSSDGKSADAKSAESTSSDSKPSDSKPSDSKPSDSKPAESKPSDSKPSTAKPSTAKPAANPSSSGRAAANA